MAKKGSFKQIPTDMLNMAVHKEGGLCTRAQILLLAFLLEYKKGDRIMLGADWVAKRIGKSSKSVGNELKTLVSLGYLKTAGKYIGGVKCFKINRFLDGVDIMKFDHRQAPEIPSGYQEADIDDSEQEMVDDCDF